MKTLFKISIIAIILFMISFSHIYAIDMFLTEYNSTTSNNEEELFEDENKSYDENSEKSEVLTTRK